MYLPFQVRAVASFLFCLVCSAVLCEDSIESVHSSACIWLSPLAEHGPSACSCPGVTVRNQRGRAVQRGPVPEGAAGLRAGRRSFVALLIYSRDDACTDRDDQSSSIGISELWQRDGLGPEAESSVFTLP